MSLHVGNKLVGEVVVAVHDAALGGELVAGARVGAVRTRLALRLVSVATPAAEVHLEDVERAATCGRPARGRSARSRRPTS